MSYKIVSKFIKDLSFEISDAKSYFLLEKNIQNYRIKIDVTSKNISENVLEIDTKLYFDPKQETKDNTFNISIVFSTLINLEKKYDKQELEKIVVIEVPSAVYPDIKTIISTLFKNSGFKEFSLPEMNFEDLYKNKKRN
tara:strand:- start:959 stop:1375 length:417 start_codon:yes stop_codon:yes gene_type:complete